MNAGLVLIFLGVVMLAAAVGALVSALIYTRCFKTRPRAIVCQRCGLRSVLLLTGDDTDRVCDVCEKEIGQ